MDEIIYGIFKVQYDFALEVWSKSIKQYNISSDELLNYSLICKWAAIGRCWGFSYHSLLSINCNAAKTKK